MTDTYVTDTLADDSSESADTAGAETWVLTIAHHPTSRAMEGQRLALSDGDTIEIGRGCEHFSQAAFDDGKVSRKHAALHCQGGKLTLRDLGSRNGTSVNGDRIDEAELFHGDVITIGRILAIAHLGARHVPRHVHSDIVGVSAAHSRILHRIAIVARKDITVLIRGETGVGKELVARAIHEQSGRPGPLVAVNCSALTEGVLASELFGHTKGAFSGAEQERDGLVAAASGGTLFLDEIGDASPAMQGALLRLLEEREYRQVGSDKLSRSDARFITATNVDLDAAVEAGRYRADLVSRLRRFVIEVPPLRERLADIIVLANHFAERKLSRSLSLALLRYAWPANVRELQAVIEQAGLESDGDALKLSGELKKRLAATPRPAAKKPIKGRGVKRDRPSSEALSQRFRELDQNASALASELGVGRTTLYRWFREAGIDVRDIRD